jgi:ABC-type branched-subunit amino acid transport system substrate-binding protein
MNSIHRMLGIALLAAATLVAPLSHAAQVLVGEVCPLSGLEANQGRAYGAGMQLYFDTVNKAGGVNGNTFALVRKDDRGLPEETVAVTRKMLAEEKPMVLAGYFGNSNIEDLVASGMLEKEKIALVGYRVTQIRPETPHLYTVRAGLQDELDKFTEHIATVGIKRIGLFYEDGPGAAALVTAAGAAAKKANITLVAKAGYPARTVEVAKAVAAMTAAAPQAIFMVATGAAAAGFIESYGRGGAQLFAHSGVDIEQLTKRLADEQMQGVSIMQVMPNPYKISIRLSKEFQDAVAAKKDLEVPVSYAMMEGFITARVIVEAARRQGAKPTREGMLGALNSMDRYDLGGYAVGYKPNSRAGSRFVELSIISGSGKIRQ